MPKPTFAQQVIEFTIGLEPNWEVPKGIEVLYPYHYQPTLATLRAFYAKYYNDHQERIAIFGINPGRFGAGITGVPFSDPIRLEEQCGIANSFDKRQELSSVFVYNFIEEYGGVKPFYDKYYITSLCPLGFTKDGKNYNYYDDRKLENAVLPHILENIRAQFDIGVSNKACICMGQGKNYQFFQKINEKYHFFEHILPVPHPRWVMQYRLKRKAEFLQLFLDTFGKAEELVGG
ncbi:MAG: DUF4918 domain-containing protein [Saprospiraceae bacterium]|nr:MAG: DUF4918 domain-containing protein [Saprospiraceae bacterium]